MLLLLIISGPTHCFSIVPVGFIKAISALCSRTEVLATPFEIPSVDRILQNLLLSRDYKYLGLLCSPQTSKAQVLRKEGHIKFPIKQLDPTIHSLLASTPSLVVEPVHGAA